MKTGRFTEEQIIGVLKEHEAGPQGGRTGAGDRRQRSDDLYLKVEVRRHGSQRDTAAEEPRR